MHTGVRTGVHTGVKGVAWRDIRCEGLHTGVRKCEIWRDIRCELMTVGALCV